MDGAYDTRKCHGRFRYPLAGNLGDTARESEFEINRLTVEYLWRQAPDTFARVTRSYFENQYGGGSTELLWSPTQSRFALGARVNYARQREFDML